jgi:hypothetical protein
MAAQTTSLFQTMVAPAGIAAAKHLRFNNALIKSVRVNAEPFAGMPGKYTTMNVLVPTVEESNVLDIGSGPLQPTDSAYDVRSIPFDQNFSNSFVINDWNQLRTPVDLKRLYLQPRLEEMVRKINRGLVSLVNATNFSSYTIVSSAAADYFARADLTLARTNMVAAGVPMDAGDLFFLMGPVPYGNMLIQSAYNVESTVGVRATEAANQMAYILPQYNMELREDQHFGVVTAGKYLGLVMHRDAIQMVVGKYPEQPESDVEEMTLMIGEGENAIPVQLQGGYSLINQGYLINIRIPWGASVVRPEWGHLLQTA